MWRHGKELGKGEGIYSMRPSEMQCDGDTKPIIYRKPRFTRFVAYRSRSWIFLQFLIFLHLLGLFPCSHCYSKCLSLSSDNFRFLDHYESLDLNSNTALPWSILNTLSTFPCSVICYFYSLFTILKLVLKLCGCCYVKRCELMLYSEVCDSVSQMFV